MSIEQPRPSTTESPKSSGSGAPRDPLDDTSCVPRTITAEHRRLEEAKKGTKWRRWGTFLSERQWGTVREDYSANGDAWNHLTHDAARSRAYRWGEDGLLGFCD